MNKKIIYLCLILIILSSTLIKFLPYITSNPVVPIGIDTSMHALEIKKLMIGGSITETVADWYSRIYYFLALTFILNTDLSIEQFLIFFPPFTLVLSGLAIFLLSRKLFGINVALIAFLIYTFISIQPLQTLWDGAVVTLVGNNFLIILFIYYLLNLEQYKEKLDIGVILTLIVLLMGCISFHIFSMTISLIILFFAFLINIKFKKDKIKLIILISIILILAFIITFPIMVKYIRTIIPIILNLFTHGQRGSAAVPPKFDYLEGFALKLGSPLLYISNIAIILFLLYILFKKKYKNEYLYILIWFSILLFGAVTYFFSAPERFLRDLSMPLSIFCAALFYILLKTFNRKFIMIIIFILISIGSITILFSNNNGIQQIRAQSYDMESYHYFDNISEMVSILSDQSSGWLKFYASNNLNYVMLPQESYKWVGNTSDQSNQILFQKIFLEPCTNESNKILKDFNIKYIYLGSVPKYWVMPGYKYNNGEDFICDKFKLVYYKKINEKNYIKIFYVN